MAVGVLAPVRQRVASRRRFCCSHHVIRHSRGMPAWRPVTTMLCGWQTAGYPSRIPRSACGWDCAAYARRRKDVYLYIHTHYHLIYIMSTHKRKSCNYFSGTVWYRVYTLIAQGAQMKITRRSDKGRGGHLLISVPANRVAEVEAALNFLEGQRKQPGSQVVIELIVRAAKRNGWDCAPAEDQSSTP